MLRNDKEEYWIAAYSVHSEILEKIVGENGEVKRLCVDCGGLRAPRDAIRSNTLLRNYVAPEKTLHAKVLLKKQKNNPTEVWLWTGNIRKATFEAQNILMSFQLRDENTKSIEKKLLDWFDCPETSLIFKSDGECITGLDLQKDECLWDEIEASFKAVQATYENGHHFVFYAISPWGGTEIVKRILRNGFSKVNLYTSYDTDERSSWIDQVLNQEYYVSSRWMAKENVPFPHMKCMFMTELVGDRENLVWSYIGSANFTNKGMLNKSEFANIEHVVLFEGKKACNSLRVLFKFLTRDLCGKYWKRRLSNFHPTIIDDDEKAKKGEGDYGENYENFERRDFCKTIINNLLKTHNQKKLDSHCDDPKWFTLAKCHLRVISIELGCYHLLAKKNGKSPIYEIDVPRILETEPPLTQREVARMIEDISYFDGYTGKSVKEKKEEKKLSKKKNDLIIDDGEALSLKMQNVRFIAQKFLDVQGNIKVDEVKKTFEKFKHIETVKDKLSLENQRFYAIWYPLLKNLMEGIK